MTTAGLPKFWRWTIFLVFVFGLTWLLMSQPSTLTFFFFVAVTVLSFLTAAFGPRILDQVAKPARVSALSAWFDQLVINTITTLRKWQHALVVIFSLVLMFIGQFQVFQDPFDVPTSSGYVFMILGLAVFFISSINWVVVEGNTLFPVQESARPFRIKVKWMAASLALAAFTAWRTTLQPEQAYLGEHLLVWGLSMVAFVKAVVPSSDQPQQPDSNPLHRWEYILLIGLFVDALLIRGINLDNVPYVFDNDEANIAVDGADIHQANFLASPFREGFQNHPLMQGALISLSSSVFGQTSAGARVPSAIMGSLTIVAIYLLGRELNDWQTGLVAALFALAWAFHVQFSRLALDQVGDPLFGTLAFYFLLRGLRRASPVDYALSGIFLGMSQLFYPTGRVYPLILLAYLVFLWLRKRQLIVKHWRMILLVPLALLVVTLPQNYYLFSANEPLVGHFYPNILFGGQLQEVINSGQNVAEYLLEQFRGSFTALISTGDRVQWYGRGSNLMGPFGGPLILIGAVASIIALWKHPQWALPLGWGVAAILVGATFSTDPPQYQRYVTGSPAFALVVSIGVITVGQAIAGRLQRPKLARNVALNIGGLLVIVNLIFYVGIYVPAKNYLAKRENWAAYRAAREMASAYDANREVILLGDPGTGVDKDPIVDYFMAGKPYLLINDEDELKRFLTDPTHHRPLTFIVAPRRDAQLKLLNQPTPSLKQYVVLLDEDHSVAFYRYDSVDVSPNPASSGG